MNTRPWIPSWLSARSRPVFASALKPRSFSPPMSVTSATRTSDDGACPPLSSPPPPQALATNASNATSARPRARRVRRDPIEALPTRRKTPSNAVGGLESPPTGTTVSRALLDRARGLDLAGRELLRPSVQLGDQRSALRRGGAHLAVADAAVLGVVEAVDATLPLLAPGELDRVEHPHVDLLQGAREDLLAEVELVGVDPDAPVLVVLRRLDGAEAAAARDLEDHVGLLADLVQRDLLALRLVDEVLRVVVQGLDARLDLLRAVLVPGDVMVDRRDLLAADGPDHARLRLRRRGDPGEASGLLLREQDAARVLRRALESGRRIVDDRELRVREPLRDGRKLVGHQEPDADDDVVAPRPGREVRDVVGRALREEDASLDAQLLLGVLQALVRERVEALVVQAADVGHERDLEAGRCLCLRRLCRADGGDGQRQRRAERKRRDDRPFANRHIPSLMVHLTGLPHCDAGLNTKLDLCRNRQILDRVGTANC